MDTFDATRERESRDTIETELARNHWERAGIGQAILGELQEEGKNLNQLTIDDLAPYDQYHGGGKEMTLLLANSAHLKPGMKILDVGGGLGGPARTLAKEFGCDVTVVDLTPSYIDAGRILTSKLGLNDHVRFEQSDALHLPFADSSFELVWTQNSGMNISNKRTLYSEFWRVLQPGGTLAFQEPMRGAAQPPIYPLMWAIDKSTDFTFASAEIKSIIDSFGFVTVLWTDVSSELEKFRREMIYPKRGIQVLVMGDRVTDISQATKRNIEENRIVLYQGVFRKPDSKTSSPTAE